MYADNYKKGITRFVVANLYARDIETISIESRSTYSSTYVIINMNAINIEYKIYFNAIRPTVCNGNVIIKEWKCYNICVILS